MTAAELIALAARVEGLTGPCRETDGLIAKALNPELDWVLFDDCWGSRCPHDGIAFDMPKPFTASLDAALGLVPEGSWFPRIDRSSPSEWRVNIGHANYGPGVNAKAPTPALALTAAALRARAAELQS